MRSHIRTNLIVMLSALLLAACADINTDVTVNVIPYPQSVEMTNSVFDMSFPRLIAIAERGWTKKENLDYSKFLERLYKEYDYLDSINVYYYDIRDFGHHPEPMR